MIYEPREDSFLLQKYVAQYARGSVLDMGSGSGIQAETALQKTKDVVAADIDDDVIVHLKKKGMEERLALTGGKYGYEILERFFSQAKSYLKNNGKILLVFSTITGDMEFLLHHYGYTFEKLDEQSFFFEKIFVYLIQPEEP